MSDKQMVYFRRKNKYSYAVELNQGVVNLKKTVGIISQKEKLNSENILLFQKGQPLAISESHSIQNGQIIHVVDTEAVKIKELSIHVKNLESIVSQYTVLPQTKIKDFIVERLAKANSLPYFHLALVYLGKILHPQKSM